MEHLWLWYHVKHLNPDHISTGEFHKAEERKASHFIDMEVLHSSFKQYAMETIYRQMFLTVQDLQLTNNKIQSEYYIIFIYSNPPSSWGRKYVNRP